MSLSALPTALLLPPANLAPIALAGMVVARRFPRVGRFMTITALLLAVLLSLPVVSHGLIAGLQHWDAPAVDKPPGAIIVLSADGVFGGDGGVLPQPGLGMMTLERLQAGAVLSRRTGLPVLLSGGVLKPGEPPIARLMGTALAQDFGIVPRWVEPRSVDTWENAQFSADQLRAAGIGSAYVVTNAWHMRRAVIAFRRAGFAIVPAPSRFEAAPGYEFDDFLPRVTALLRSYYAVHEWIGCVWYEWRG